MDEKFWLSISTEIDIKLVALRNALLPILVTLGGMVIDVKLVAFWNALLPILVTLVGMVIDAKLIA